MGGRCWRDFFSFSFSCSHLIGNKFTPCAQAGSVLPVLVLRVGSLPVFLCPPGPFLVFPLPVQLQRARTEQFWWLLAFWQDQPSPGSSKGLLGVAPFVGHVRWRRVSPLLQPQPSGSTQPSREHPHLGPHFWTHLSHWTAQYPSWSSPEFLNIWNPIFRAVLGLHSLFFVVGVLQGWALREAFGSFLHVQQSNSLVVPKIEVLDAEIPPQPLAIC